MANESLPTNFRTINLSQGKVALVSIEDYERVSQFKWTAAKVTRKGRLMGYYAMRGIWFPKEKKLRRVYLHRFILDAPDGLEVDHKNRDGLDCRRDNLRLATSSQNRANRAKLKLGNRYRGVWRLSRDTSRWTGQVQHKWKRIHLGIFATEEEAARAYDKKALELFGEFAQLNFPNEK